MNLRVSRDNRDSLVFVASIGAFTWTFGLGILFTWDVLNRDVSSWTLPYGALSLILANVWLFLIGSRARRWVESGS